MDILYISPEFPPNYANFIRQLHAAGLRVWAIGEADFFAMPADLRACIRWYVRGDLKNWRERRAGHRRTARGQARPGFRGRLRPGRVAQRAVAASGGLHQRAPAPSPGITLRDVDRLKKKVRHEERLSRQRSAGGPRRRWSSTSTRRARLAAETSATRSFSSRTRASGPAAPTGSTSSRANSKALFPGCTRTPCSRSSSTAPIVTYDGLTGRDGEVVFENSLVYGEGLIEYARGKDTFFYARPRIPAQLASHRPRSLVRRFEHPPQVFPLRIFCGRRGLPSRSRSTAARRAAPSWT